MRSVVITSPRIAAAVIMRLCAPAPNNIARAAERVEPSMRRLFLRAVEASQKKISIEALDDAVTTFAPNGNRAVAVCADALDTMIDTLWPRSERWRTAEAAKTLQQLYLEALHGGARIAAKPLKMAFDVANPAAIAWAQENAALLVTAISDEARETIRNLVVAGFENGIPPRDTARLIRANIWLTPRDANAVVKRYQKMVEEGVTRTAARARAEKHTQKLIRSRAQTIARTETMRASNEGQAQLWQQAREMGLLTGRERKVWQVADPCPICAPLDGESVGMDEEFSVGQDPPLHPRCRCTISLVMN